MCCILYYITEILIFVVLRRLGFAKGCTKPSLLIGDHPAHGTRMKKPSDTYITVYYYICLLCTYLYFNLFYPFKMLLMGFESVVRPEFFTAMSDLV